MVWEVNGTPDTLGSASDTLLISDQTSTTFNVVLSMPIFSGSCAIDYRFGNTTIDSGNNYSSRGSANGATDGTSTNNDSIERFNAGSNVPSFFISYVINISSEEKLVLAHHCTAATTGAATPPNRSEIVGKWANTSAQFDNISVVNVDTGSYDTDSNLSALGTN